MYIRRIIICGFKSYKKKVVLDLSPGHNVVVGANGSGKSNIYDALEFVLSSKYDMLRSEQRKQLLHDAGQSGVVSAFVEIIFDNSDGRFPLNENVISIKRTIGAKKDEYFVNQRHCDKTELNNLLESAGISKYNQHFIVPQGQIAERVKERDNERLSLIKEIAGTRVYDERRNESCKLMSNADNKREKVRVVIDYFEQRLDELSEEKEELAKFEKLETKKRSIEYQIYDKERRETQRALDALQLNEGKTDEKNEELHGELKQIKQEIDSYNTEGIELNDKLEKLVVEMKKKRKELQGTERLIVSLETKNRSLQKDNAEYKGKKEEYESELEEVNGEIDGVRVTLAEISESFEAQKHTENEYRENLKRNEQKMKDLYAKQERLGQYKSKKERNKQLKNEIKTHKKEVIEQEKLCTNLSDSNGATDNKLNIFANELRDLEKLQSANEGLFDRNEKKKEHYKRERNKFQNERKILWKNLNDLNKNLDELRCSKNKTENDYRFTMNLNQYQSYMHMKRIQKDIMLNGEESRYKLSGRLYGALIENFTVIDAKYNIAVEAAASNKLFYYLVDNDQVASELIGIMQRERINRVTFIPLNRCKNGENKRKYPGGSADVIPIMKLLRYDDSIEGLDGALQQIFGNTLIPHDLNIGYEYAIRENYQCVTLDGDIVTSGGAMDGGYNVNKYKRLKCYNLIAEINQKYETLLADKARNEDKLREIENELLLIDNAIRENDNLNNKIRNDLTENKEKLIEIEEEIENEQELKNNNLNILNKHKSNILRIQSSISSIEKEMKQALKNRLSEAEELELKNIQFENEKIRENLAICIIESGRIETEKSKLLSLLRDNLNANKKELLHKIKKCLLINNNEQSIDLTLNKLQNETEKKEKLISKIKKGEKNVDSFQKRMKIIESSLSNLTSNEQELLLEIEQHSISCEKLVGRHQAFSEKLSQFTKYIVELGALSHGEINKYKNKSVSHLNNMLSSMKKDLLSYKNVNKKALNQYNSFNKEKKKLYSRNEQQLTDKDHIEKLIQHLDLKKDDAILRTFHAINDNFKKAFKSLVLRGNAKLILFQHENEDEKEENGDEENGFTQSQSQQRRRRRRSSNVRRNRRKSSLASQQQQQSQAQSQLFELDELQDKKYAGVGIRVSFGDGAEVESDEDSDGDVDEKNRARDMRQLSGGQQTVVALALIFAIQRCDPSPFYVFDEIDAALDQQYRKAVADIIHSMKGKTQFITTTFRPEILQQADRCFVVDFKAKISTIKQVDDVTQVDLTKFT